MEIQTTLKLTTLQTINQLWMQLDFEDTFQGRINKSIVQYTSTKFLKKEVSRIGKPKDKKFTISNHHFELAIIEQLLRAAVLVKFGSESFEYHQVTNYCNQIHQKIV